MEPCIGYEDLQKKRKIDRGTDNNSDRYTNIESDK